MEGDRLIVELGLGRFALSTSAVAGIVEVEKVPFLPGQRGFVAGIISLRQEPVTVVSLRRAMGDFTESGVTSHRVIVVREKNRLLGLDIEGAPVTFIWDEEIKGKVTEEKGLYTSGRIYTGEGAPIDVIDWAALFNEASRILSSQGNA